MSDLDAFYRIYLKKGLESRTLRNRRYSVRAYARSLGVDNGYLSRLLSGKLLLSLELAGKILSRLELTDVDRREFILSAAEEQKCHALYLLDPSLTDCASELHETNVLPTPRKREC